MKHLYVHMLTKCWPRKEWESWVVNVEYSGHSLHRVSPRHCVAVHVTFHDYTGAKLHQGGSILLGNFIMTDAVSRERWVWIEYTGQLQELKNEEISQHQSPWEGQPWDFARCFFISFPQLHLKQQWSYSRHAKLMWLNVVVLYVSFSAT